MSAPSPSAGPPPGAPAIQTAARLLAAGRAAEAAAQLRQLVAEAPTYAAAHVLLASALDAAGRPADALDVWRRAAFLVPHSPLVHRERQRLMDAQSARPATPEMDPEAAAVEAWDTEALSEREMPFDSAEPTDSAEAQSDAPEPSETDGWSLSDPLDESADDPPEPDPRPLDVADLVPPASDERTSDEPQLDAPDAISGEPTDAPPHASDIASDESHPPRSGQAPEPFPSDASPPPPEASAAPVAETPLLPPEESSPARPLTEPVVDDDPGDAGWTIIEDDAVSPPRAAAPQPTPLLPPQAEDAPGAPEPLARPAGDARVADDLDDLISQLDAAPRIKPDPAFRGPAVTFDDSSVDDMASETLAKIYAAQHQYVQAARIYETLAAREPAHAAAHLERAAELRERADG